MNRKFINGNRYIACHSTHHVAGSFDIYAKHLVQDMSAKHAKNHMKCYEISKNAATTSQAEVPSPLGAISTIRSPLNAISWFRHIWRKGLHDVDKCIKINQSRASLYHGDVFTGHPLRFSEDRVRWMEGSNLKPSNQFSCTLENIK